MVKILIKRNINFNQYKQESTGSRYFKDSKAFIEYSNDIDDIYKNIEEYNPNKKSKVLVVFDDMIADMLSNKKLNSVVTELFIRGRKLNILLVFIAQSCFTVPENVMINSSRYNVMEVPKKRELQQIAFNHSSEIDFKGITIFLFSYCCYSSIR